ADAKESIAHLGFFLKGEFPAAESSRWIASAQTGRITTMPETLVFPATSGLISIYRNAAFTAGIIRKVGRKALLAAISHAFVIRFVELSGPPSTMACMGRPAACRST